jgi:PKD repeat protein
MKKLTILFICLISISTVFAQVPRDKVVVEIATGTWCGFCPWAAQAADNLVANGFPVAIMENHGPMNAGDPFANQYSTARNSFYGVPGYPTAWFDGGSMYVGGSSATYNNYVTRVQTRMSTPSPVTIEVYGTHAGLTYDVTAIVTKVSEITGSNIKLQLALTESNIVYSWQGQTHCNFVNRLMVPDQNGTTLDFTNSNVLEIPLTFNLQMGWVLGNMELIAFVQTNSSKEIQNAYKVSLMFLPPPPPPLTAAFSSDTTVCATGKVQYNDQSTGNPTGWSWVFPGGIPETSTDQNPLITYNDPGVFDVTLTVTGGSGNNTINAPEYLDVFALPEVTFSAMEDQCINYEPIELTQGSPAGGTYSGPGVEEGFFHPDVAGIGTHTLVYTFIGDNGCQNFAEQAIVVDACTGLPENGEVRIVTLPNPTQGTFRLTVPGLEEMANLRIVNSTGKTVYQKDNVSLNGSSGLTIDLSGNSSGIYYINVEGKNSTYYKKIILQK